MTLFYAFSSLLHYKLGNNALSHHVPYHFFKETHGPSQNGFSSKEKYSQCNSTNKALKR